MADIDPHAPTDQPSDSASPIGAFLTLSFFVALGVAANIFDITNTWLDGVESVAVSTGIGLVLVGSYLMWSRTRQRGTHVPPLGLLVSAGGLLLASGVAAYDAGESAGSSRRSDLEAANADLRQRNDELSRELADADDAVEADDPGIEEPSSDTTSPTSTTTTSSERTEEGTVYVADLDIVGTWESLVPGTWEVEGVQYQNSLGTNLNDAEDDAEADYNVRRHYRQFHASVGLTDEAHTDDVVTFVLRLDGTVRFDRDVGVGETVVVDEDISDAYRLALEVSCDSCSNEAFAVWGEATVTT